MGGGGWERRGKDVTERDRERILPPPKVKVSRINTRRRRVPEIYYTMCISFTRNALILSGGRGYSLALVVVGADTRHLPPPRTHVPVTNPRQDRRTRQLFSGRGGCAKRQMSVSVISPEAAAVMVGGVFACSGTARSTQPCIPSGSLNRVPASAGVRAGMSPLPGGR